MAVAAFFLWVIASPSSAWMIQLPSDSAADPEDVERFSEASEEVLRGAANLFEAMAIAEAEHIPLDQSGFREATGRIEHGAAMYRQLVDSSLRDVPLEWNSAVKRLVTDLALQQSGESSDAEMTIREMDLRSAADLALLLGAEAGDLAGVAEDLVKHGFGPQQAANLDARFMLSLIFDQIDRFGQIANAGTMAMLAAR